MKLINNHGNFKKSSKVMLGFHWRGRKKDCARCSFTFFESELVRDGISKNWVCKTCYDPPEQRSK